MSGWLSADTAPMDGSRFLARDKSGYVSIASYSGTVYRPQTDKARVFTWEAEVESDGYGWYGHARECEIAGWMPLPTTS